MAKATTTIRQTLNYKSEHDAWFAANQALFNQVAAFYFSVIQAHELVLELGNQEALTALEHLTHTTKKNPHPVTPLSEIAEDVPAMFRRAAIHAALGVARSFYAHLNKWRARKEKALAKGKKFTERPPVPPRSWNTSATIYAGKWKERSASSIMLKLWTGTCWSWVRCRITGRKLPDGVALGSPQLVRHGKEWWLHTPVEKQFSSPAKVEEQITTNAQITICAVDLNLDGAIAVCTVQTAEGSTIATRFISGGRAVSGFRKRQLGRIARNRAYTGLLALGEQDNADLWRKITHRDEDVAHQVSHRIVQFAREQGASILVFEHLGHLKPEKGRYSHRGNQKRAFWMKGRIFRMRGHADRDASLKIGQRLMARYHKTPKQEKPEEKPHAPLPRVERSAKAEGVLGAQDARGKKPPSMASTGHGTGNGHGTAQKGKRRRMGQPSLSIPPQLRLPRE
jgi:putative transposase